MLFHHNSEQKSMVTHYVALLISMHWLGNDRDMLRTWYLTGKNNGNCKVNNNELPKNVSRIIMKQLEVLPLSDGNFSKIRMKLFCKEEPHTAHWSGT